MRSNDFVNLFFLFCSLAFSPSVVTASVDFQGVGIAPGYSSSEAIGISANGQVVVGRNRDSTGLQFQAFRWTVDSGMDDLNGVPGAQSSSYAVAASADGSLIIGDVQNPGENRRGFRWTSAGGMVLMNATESITPRSAVDITPDGKFIVGSGQTPAFVNGSTTNESYYWTSSSNTTSIGDLFGDIVLSGAAGVSADGSVIAGFATDSNGTQAYRWTSSTGMVSLGDLPGSPFRSFANDVSDDGSTIVGRGNVASGSSQAFRWTSQTGMVGLGNLPGGRRSEAQSVTHDGSTIVGGSDLGAFIWTADIGMVRLYDYLLARGTTGLESWILDEAHAITPNGRTIVGRGRNPLGQTEGFVVTIIPEPTTLTIAMLGLASVTLGWTRNRRWVAATLDW